MGESRSIAGGAILFTDSYKESVNGISVFTQFFIRDYLKSHFDDVWVYETSTTRLYKTDGKSTKNPRITNLYVNANFSASDYLIRSSDVSEIFQQHGLVAADDLKKTMISHGWPRIRFRITYYNIYYALRNITRAKDLQRLFYYQEILFISRAIDTHRHEDHQYCLENKLPISYYDFAERFIAENRNLKAGSYPNHLEEILVIANFQKVKNVWWLLRYNLKRRIAGKKMKPFCLLIYPQKSGAYKLFALLADKLSVRLEHDQEKKKALLQQSAYLFIPSFSEYNPLVALEATACFTPVVSLYTITALKGIRSYRYLRQ